MHTFEGTVGNQEEIRRVLGREPVSLEWKRPACEVHTLGTSAKLPAAPAYQVPFFGKTSPVLV